VGQIADDERERWPLAFENDPGCEDEQPQRYRGDERMCERRPVREYVEDLAQRLVDQVGELRPEGDRDGGSHSGRMPPRESAEETVGEVADSEVFPRPHVTPPAVAQPPSILMAA